MYGLNQSVHELLDTELAARIRAWHDDDEMKRRGEVTVTCQRVA